MGLGRITEIEALWNGVCIVGMMRPHARTLLAKARLVGRDGSTWRVRGTLVSRLPMGIVRVIMRLIGGKSKLTKSP